ncbi:MAG: UDP-N-acetylmuramoyl-L-alanine--D-glutamate ligase [Spirochaetes bacterium]|nr:UDP-N-acetylmuramoyl-L-alanine--D-glutamate ligase [Spirochaetota bacterium]
MNTDNINSTYLASIKDKRFLIVGLGKRTGVSAANLFEDLGIRYALSDSKPKDGIKDSIALLKNKNAVLFSGEQNPEQLDGIDIVLLSPGVPPDIPLVTEAMRRGIPVLSEIELGFNLIRDAVFIGITGTDGKTTTTTLTSQILATTYPVHTLGNIGVALCDRITSIRPKDIVLLELSSFQLEMTDRFRPHIAALLNLSYDHLDRYKNMDEYFAAKKRITLRQTRDDTLILNADNAYTAAFAREIQHTSVRTFSSSKQADMCLDGDYLMHNGKQLFSLSNVRIAGVHNRENIMAAALIALGMDVPVDRIEKAVNDFRGVPHRIELVPTNDGIRWYNDSKATTLQAVMRALESFPAGVILIMGGRNKGLDFGLLKDQIHAKAKKLIVTGEASDEIAAAIMHPDTQNIRDFDEAVAAARKAAKAGDVILFSPACTSYDRFRNYEERGDYFKSLVTARA